MHSPFKRCIYICSGPGGPHDGGGEEDGEASHLQGKPTILFEMSGIPSTIKNRSSVNILVCQLSQFGHIIFTRVDQESEFFS